MTEAEQRLRRMTSIAWVGDPAELNAMWKETLLAAYQRGRDEAVLNVLWLAHAIETHTARWPAHEPIHDDGTCSTDCAGDIAARYRAEADR